MCSAVDVMHTVGLSISSVLPTVCAIIDGLDLV